MKGNTAVKDDRTESFEQVEDLELDAESADKVKGGMMFFRDKHDEFHKRNPGITAR